MYGLFMDITWDPEKAAINFQKHKVRFSDAEAALYDPLALTLKNQIVSGERRFVSVGTDAIGRQIVLVYAYRGDSIRLISARRATSRERKQYEKGI